jgi:hypothetical protein
MSETKFVGSVRLVEACQRPGCPVCVCVVDDSRSYLAALLYEHVTDVDTRRALRAAGGFCSWHTAMLPDLEQSAFGAAIIYADLLRLALRQTEGVDHGPPRRWLAGLRRRSRPAAVAAGYRRRAPCPACVSVAATERGCLDTLVRCFDDLEAAYARSDGLCVPHLFEALEVADDGGRLGGLVARTREKWRQLGGTLDAFVAKHDHRNREAYTEDEVAAPRRAFAVLAGARSGAHARRPPP